MNKIYLDNAASTPMLPLAVDTYVECLRNDMGNPSAIHQFGRKNRALIEGARSKVAQGLNASIGEIFFTSGGTESNNTALNTAVDYLEVKRIISSPTEHPSVRNTLAYLSSKKKVEVVLLPVDLYGNPDMNKLESLLKEDKKKTLVSLMHANNEIGTMIDLKEVGNLCADHGAYFHSDTVQTVGHEAIDLAEIPLTFLSASAHKFHGPKGSGILYCNNHHPCGSLIKGGAQERNMRAGTENVAAIAATGEVLDYMLKNLETHKSEILTLRSYLKKSLERHIPGVEFNGNQEKAFLFTVLSVGFPKNSKSDMLIPLLDIEGIAVSGSSACSSGAEKESKIIQTIKPNNHTKTIRFSFSHLNTKAEMDTVVEKLKKLTS